jgi:hypothetical protein
MRGRHRAAPDRFRWRRSSVPAAIPVPRRVGIEVVCAETKTAHRVSVDEMTAGHRCGDFLAFCGVRFPAASLTDPGCSQCQRCREHLS